MGPRPASKRQRVSGESAGSSSMPTSPVDTTQMLQNFKELSLDNKLETMFSCLLDVKATNDRLLNAERTVKHIKESTQVNCRRIDLLAYKSIDIESRQRRNNLLFWGIPEGRGDDCIAEVSCFLEDKLGLDGDEISIQRAHRIDRVQRQTLIGRSANARPRPLIALFRDYQDVELVLSNANKLQGTPFGINRDYPREIINARKTLLKEKKDLKLKYPSANISIQYPAKLVCDKRVVKDMFPNWFSVMKGDRLDANLGRLRQKGMSPFDEDGGEVFASDSEHTDDGVNNDIEMSDQSGAARGPVHTPAPPPLPKSPPPSLPMEPSLANGYITMNGREDGERTIQDVQSNHIYHTGHKKSTEGAPSASTSRPPDQTLTA